MNELIQSVAQQGLSMTYYGWICDAGLILSIIYSLYHGKRYGINLWKMVIIIAGAYVGRVALQSGMWEILEIIEEAHFLGIQSVTNSIVRTFIFIPLIMWPFAKIFKYKWGHVCDSIVMFPLLTSAIAQIACLFTGCCKGYEVGWGIYNIRTEGYHFPTPIIETVLTLIIFSYLVYRTHKRKYVSDGKLYPLMMVMYGIMRFICEMLRDNEKIFLGQSGVGIHAIILFVVGFICLYWIKKRDEKKAKEEALAAAESKATEKSDEENISVDPAKEKAPEEKKKNKNRKKKNKKQKSNKKNKKRKKRK